MGKAASSTEQTPLPRTRCSQCRTEFEIAPAMLASADTRVRCGECFAIFDALANLRDPGVPGATEEDAGIDDPEGGTAPSPTNDDRAADGARSVLSRPADDADAYAADGYGDGQFDVTYSDFDLFSADAELPAVAYPDDTSDTAEFGLGTVSEADPEADSDAVAIGARDGGTASPAPSADAGKRTGERAEAATDDGVPDELRSRRTATPAEGPAGAGAGSGAGSGAGAGGRDALVGASPDAAAATPVETADASTPARVALARGDAPDEGGGATLDDASAPVPADPPFLPSDLAPSLIGIDEPVERSSIRGGTWVLRGLMALVLASLLVGLYLYRERERLHNDPLGRPLLTFACRISGCLVPSRVELASLKLLGKEVFTHPSVERALVINVAFRNDAEFAQRYPVLVVRLRDRVGRSVAERDFNPADYLDEWAPGDTLPAGRRLDITLEVDDPGDSAESYEFEFREAEA